MRQEAVFSFDLATQKTKECTKHSSKLVVYEKLNDNDLLRLSRLKLTQAHKQQHQQFLEYKIVNDLIYNEPTTLVSLFKDYLIMDDINEFFKRPYQFKESSERIPKLGYFYQQTSIVLPNYFALG